MPLPYTYSTVYEAVSGLQERGYTTDFNLLEAGLEAPETGRFLSPDDFEIVELYRFEGTSDPADMSIVYAIESKDGLKGILVNAFGTYGSETTTRVIEKLRVSQPQTPVGYEQPQPESDTGNLSGTAGLTDKYRAQDEPPSGDAPRTV